MQLTFHQYLERQNLWSPLSIESILATMSSNMSHNFSKDGEEDLNNNSFLMKTEEESVEDGFGGSGRDEGDLKEVCEEMKEDGGPECDGPSMGLDEDCQGGQDLDVASINMEDSLHTDESPHSGQYSCHLCSFVCIKKHEFHQHLLTHYTYSCAQCDYASRTEGRLKRHVKDFHSSDSPENFSGQKVPSNNPKSLKCKHCGIISSTKEKHWSHQRTHLDVTKCLQCPKCPFITEYKHHLEYHIRNHDKIKPYKCSKCQYRCVNKSMLNSHKKSHSNVYQFRCADCSYASKYCHSLKQHLTRHGHQPAPVLNEDGSLPTYDNSNEILSMKRGPNNRNISSQNSINCFQDHSQAFPSIPTSTIRQDMPITSSAFSAFKKDHIDSLLSWTLKQCYPLPQTRFLSSSFPLIPLMPPIPSIMSLPGVHSGLPSGNKEALHSFYQSSALDLSIKTNTADDQKSQTYECSLCHMQFFDQKLLESHILFHGRFNNFRCTKCGTLYNNVMDFFAHFARMCRD